MSFQVESDTSVYLFLESCMIYFNSADLFYITDKTALTQTHNYQL